MMNTENVEMSVLLPRNLWEQLHGYAQMEQVEETSLLIRAVEQFLQQEIMSMEVINGQNGVHTRATQQEPRKTSAMGKYAHIPGTTEEFMQAKQAEIEYESRSR